MRIMAKIMIYKNISSSLNKKNKNKKMHKIDKEWKNLRMNFWKPTRQLYKRTN